MRKPTVCRRKRQRHAVKLQLECLESRLAPATLVNPTTLTYQDVDGDLATVKISKPVFDSATINSVFTFDSGSVNGSNSTPQQLQRIDLTPLGAAVSGASLSVTAHKSSTGGNGLVNVGFINTAGIDLNSVQVQGDLGRIRAGDGNTATPGLAALTVSSMGVLGTTTQAPGGDLFSAVQGELISINIQSDIVGASIMVVGGAAGQIASINIGGSVIGTNTGGLISSEGNIDAVTIGHDLRGGPGLNSGQILSGASIGNIDVDGSILGGDWQESVKPR